MTRLILAALALLFTAAAAAAYEETVKFKDQPDLQVILGPRQAFENGAYLGGQIVLRLRLLSVHRFEALEIVLPEVDGAERVTVMQPRTREVNSVAGDGFVLETAVAYFTKRAGELTIPPVVAIGKVRPEQELEAFELTTEPTSLTVYGVQDGFEDAPWIVANRMEITETLSHRIAEIRQGDIIRREATMTAFGVRAERLPELVMPPIDGAQVSAGQERRRTELSPDGVVGRVTRVWDIRIDDPVLVELPPLGAPYWHAVDHRRADAATQGWRIEPLPADPAAAAAALLQTARAERRGDLAAGFALGLLLLAPLFAIAALYLFALAPSRADLALARAARRGGDQRAFYRAARLWAEQSQVALAASPGAGGLAQSVFGPGPGAAAAPPDIARDLIGRARRRRAAAVSARLARLRDRLVGANRGLGDGPSQKSGR